METSARAGGPHAASHDAGPASRSPEAFETVDIGLGDGGGDRGGAAKNYVHGKALRTSAKQLRDSAMGKLRRLKSHGAGSRQGPDSGESGAESADEDRGSGSGGDDGGGSRDDSASSTASTTTISDVKEGGSGFKSRARSAMERSNKLLKQVLATADEKSSKISENVSEMWQSMSGPKRSQRTLPRDESDNKDGSRPATRATVAIDTASPGRSRSGSGGDATAANSNGESLAGLQLSPLTPLTVDFSAFGPESNNGVASDEKAPAVRESGGSVEHASAAIEIDSAGAEGKKAPASSSGSSLASTATDEEEVDEAQALPAMFRRADPLGLGPGAHSRSAGALPLPSAAEGDGLQSAPGPSASAATLAAGPPLIVSRKPSLADITALQPTAATAPPLAHMTRKPSLVAMLAEGLQQQQQSSSKSTAPTAATDEGGLPPPQRKQSIAALEIPANTISARKASLASLEFQTPFLHSRKPSAMLAPDQLATSSVVAAGGPSMHARKASLASLEMRRPESPSTLAEKLAAKKALSRDISETASEASAGSGRNSNASINNAAHGAASPATTNTSTTALKAVSSTSVAATTDPHTTRLHHLTADRPKFSRQRRPRSTLGQSEPIASTAPTAAAAITSDDKQQQQYQPAIAEEERGTATADSLDESAQ